VTQAKDKFNMMEIKTIIETIGIEAITEIFPIIFVSPATADRLFTHKVPLFDTVILEDAEYISPKLGRKLIRLGAQKIVTGKPNKDANHYLAETEHNPLFQKHTLTGSFSKDGKAVQSPKMRNYFYPIAFRKALAG